jgi:hypothetical protein
MCGIAGMLGFGAEVLFSVQQEARLIGDCYVRLRGIAE